MPSHAAHPMGVNMVVNFFAATVFTSLMCIFWWYMGSKELVEAVNRKAKMLQTAREKLAEEPLLRNLAVQLDARIEQAEAAVARDAQNAAAYAAEQNKVLIYFWMVPVISLYLGLLGGAVTYNNTRTYFADDPHVMSFGHYGGLLLVFLSYLPEVLFFLFVIEWLVPMGDYEAAQRVCGFR